MFLRERLLRSNGMWTYSVRRMTEGACILARAECSSVSWRSSARATPFSIRTIARRIVQTLIGSWVEFRTSTLPFIATPHEKRKRRHSGPAQAIGPRALMNAPDDCEIGLIAEGVGGASARATPRLRLMD